MRTTADQIEVTLSPSKRLFFSRLALFVFVSVFILFMPILMWGKLAGTGLVLLIALKHWRDWQARKNQVLRFVPSADSCILEAGQQCRLAANQFVTGKLVIVYLITAGGKKISFVIPIDAMPEEQHRGLRQLLVARTSAG